MKRSLLYLALIFLAIFSQAYTQENPEDCPSDELPPSEPTPGYEDSEESNNYSEDNALENEQSQSSQEDSYYPEGSTIYDSEYEQNDSEEYSEASYENEYNTSEIEQDVSGYFSDDYGSDNYGSDDYGSDDYGSDSGSEGYYSEYSEEESGSDGEGEGRRRLVGLNDCALKELEKFLAEKQVCKNLFTGIKQSACVALKRKVYKQLKDKCEAL